VVQCTRTCIIKNVLSSIYSRFYLFIIFTITSSYRPKFAKCVQLFAKNEYKSMRYKSLSTVQVPSTTQSTVRTVLVKNKFQSRSYKVTHFKSVTLKTYYLLVFQNMKITLHIFCFNSMDCN